MFDQQQDQVYEVYSDTGSEFCSAVDQEEPTMHVRFHLSEWHKFTARKSWRRQDSVQPARTCCGKIVDGYIQTREESYEGDLCTICFTDYERNTYAPELARQHAEEQRIRDEKEELKRIEEDRLWEEKRRRAREKLDQALGRHLQQIQPEEDK